MKLVTEPVHLPALCRAVDAEIERRELESFHDLIQECCYANEERLKAMRAARLEYDDEELGKLLREGIDEQVRDFLERKGLTK